MLMIRNAPQGVSSYSDPSAWPFVGGESHWGNQFAGDDMWETQLSCSTKGLAPGAPVWAELGNQAVTVPISLQLCSVSGISGSVVLIWGEYANHQQFPVVMDQAGPYTASDPSVMPIYTGKTSFNLADAALTDTTGLCPVHGWTAVTIKCRTVLSNGDQFDTELQIPVYTTIDTTQPESTLKEEGIGLLVRTKGSIAHNLAGIVPNGDLWGAHLVAVRDQSVPILAPWSNAYYERVFGYSYGQDPGLTPLIPVDYLYTAEIDGDDDATPPVPPLQLATTPFEQIGNFDSLDPLLVSKSAPYPGLGPNQHMLCLVWKGDTSPSNGVTSGHTGQHIPAGMCLETVLALLVTTGPNPQGAVPLTLLPVPEVVGMPLAQAEAAIVAAGFRVGDVSYNIPPAAGFTAGEVWTQNPVVDPQPLPPGTLIDLGVAFSASAPPHPPPPPPPQLVGVPNVVGLTQSAAMQAIVGAGLVVGTITSNPQTVVSESPSAGTSVAAGTAINLVMA